MKLLKSMSLFNKDAKIVYNSMKENRLSQISFIFMMKSYVHVVQENCS